MIFFHICNRFEVIQPQKRKNADRDMRKVAKHLLLSTDYTIFADVIIGDGVFSLRSMMHDRLTSFDLAKSGKFNIRCQNELSQAGLVPSTEGTDCFTVFVDTGYFPEPCQANIGSGTSPLSLCH